MQLMSETGGSRKNFANAMPNFIKRKLLDQYETASVQDLSIVARHQMVFYELCPSDDWTKVTFNEISSTLSENLVAASTKLTQQDQLKQQQTDLFNRINTRIFRIIKIQILATTVSTVNNDKTIDLTTHEVFDEDIKIMEDGVASITTEDTLMVNKIEITTTLIPSITHHKSKNRPTMNMYRNRP